MCDCWKEFVTGFLSAALTFIKRFVHIYSGEMFVYLSKMTVTIDSAYHLDPSYRARFWEAAIHDEDLPPWPSATASQDTTF